jgi:hypothetical protein
MLNQVLTRVPPPKKAGLGGQGEENRRQQYKETYASVHVERQPPIARPPGNLGTSGEHIVPDVSPSLDPAILGQVAPNDKIRQTAVQALTIAKQQAEAARHGSQRRCHVVEI